MTTTDLDNLRKLADDMHSRAALSHAARHALGMAFLRALADAETW